LSFNTNYNGKKISLFKSFPECEVLFYFPSKRYQARFTVLSEVLYNNKNTKESWDKMQPMSRVCYQQEQNPGDILKPNDKNLTMEQAYNNFCIVKLNIVKLDFLGLSSTGHKRYFIDFSKGYLKPKITNAAI
jgi:hypothetical protein